MKQESTVKKRQANLSSPEQLGDYLKVTTPKVWVLLGAVVLIIVALFTWGATTVIESYASGTAIAKSGELAITFDDQTKASKVKAGMELEIGDAKSEIETVGTDDAGNVIASAKSNVPDGSYNIKVGYNSTQVISMLLN